MATQVGLTVVSVLRSGGEYEPIHVQALAKQVAHYMPWTRFVCLSDTDIPGVDRVPMLTDWPIWWSKIELFRNFKRRTLYLDLDTIILADLSSMAGGRFRMCRHPKPISRTDRRHVWLSPIMAWDGDYSHIADEFERERERVMRTYNTAAQWGDQAFIAENVGHEIDEIRGAVHYRYECLGRVAEPNAMAVIFAAQYRPWNVPQQWARRWWPQ